MMQTNNVVPGYIGRFRIINALGKGSQGIVYLAADTQLERNVAIKTIQLDNPSQKLKDQLLKEARLVSKLQHPNIITLYEADEHAGKPYLVFEYVDGTSLRQHLQQQVRLSSKEAINIMAPLLNAIAYAHKRGVIHCDLNPENIMLTAEHNPRLMDFGIATLLGKREEDGIWGTLKYLSPEQCENKPATAASDIFSLGLILYEMLTGKPAVEADNRFAIINQIVNEDIPIPSDVEPGLHGVFRKALAKDPAARYNDALDMKQDLVNHLEKISPEISSSTQQTSEASSSTLQFLLRRMAYKKDFPTISHQIVEISQKSKANSADCANSLANAILKDYSLSSKILRLVNSPLYGHYGGKISTISRAVVILGFEEIRNAALGLMLLDHLKDKNQASNLKEAVISSMMSGSIAQGLANKLKIRDAEEAYVCSMFHQLGKLLAIYYFPEEVEMIMDLVKHKHMKEDHAAQAVLGVSYEEIGIAVGESWQLPHEMVESMHSLPPGELKKPLSQSDLLKHVTGFSNEYTQLISSTSAADRHQSFENLASRYSNTMSLSRGQMEDILGEAIKEIEKFSSLVNLDLKGSNLYKKASVWSSKSPRLVETSDNPPLAETDDVTQQDLAKKEQLIQSIQEISDAIVEGASLNEILIMVMETVFSSFHFTRVMFCLINKSRTSLNARFGFGRDVEALINRLSIPLGSDRDIFNQALKQHKDLIIEDITRNCSSLLPRWYCEEYAKKSMLIYPIVVKNIPMGLIYADSMLPVHIRDESHYSVIKTLRNLIIMSIRQSG